MDQPVRTFPLLVRAPSSETGDLVFALVLDLDFAREQDGNRTNRLSPTILPNSDSLRDGNGIYPDHLRNRRFTRLSTLAKRLCGKRQNCIFDFFDNVTSGWRPLADLYHGTVIARRDTSLLADIDPSLARVTKAHGGTDNKHITSFELESNGTMNARSHGWAKKKRVRGPGDVPVVVGPEHAIGIDHDGIIIRFHMALHAVARATAMYISSSMDRMAKKQKALMLPQRDIDLPKLDQHTADMIGHLVCGDALRVVDTMGDNSISGVITSPPYNLGKNPRHKGPHDSDYYLFDGETCTDDMDDAAYVQWLVKLFKKLERVVIDRGCVLLNITSSTTKMILPFRVLDQIDVQTDWTIADVLYWHKASARIYQSSPTKASPLIEPVYVLSRKAHIRNFQSNKPVNKVDARTGQFYYNKVVNVIHANNGSNSKLNKATFSEELVHDLYNRYFPDGSVVLDPFAGSGTVLDASRVSGQRVRSIGIEISQKQVDLYETDAEMERKARVREQAYKRNVRDERKRARLQEAEEDFRRDENELETRHGTNPSPSLEPGTTKK